MHAPKLIMSQLTWPNQVVTQQLSSQHRNLVEHGTARDRIVQKHTMRAQRREKHESQKQLQTAMPTTRVEYQHTKAAHGTAEHRQRAQGAIQQHMTP